MRNCGRFDGGGVDAEWTMDLIESLVLGLLVVTPQMCCFQSI